MLILYRVLITLLYPFLLLLIYYRKIIKKEDPNRYKEKIFRSHFKILKKENTRLLWFHAASIGEFKSILPIIKELNLKKNNLEFLITTNTVSSGNLAVEEFKKYKNMNHRFFPLDVGFLIKGFLDTYKPDFLFLVDSEIWPNLILQANKKKIPLAIINARITKKSFTRWNYFPSISKKIFSNFDFILTSNLETKNFLNILGAKNINFVGNIKFIKDNSKIAEKSNLDLLKSKKFWLAASTHEGEEIFCINVHKELKRKFKDILTIIAPRHIHRTYKIKNICEKNNLSYQILNNDEPIMNGKEIILINSFGVLHNFYFQAKSVFIGKSNINKLKNVSGQNPIDAANLGCKIYHGPYVYNFSDIYDILKIHKISKEINNYEELAENISRDLNDIKKDNDQFKDVIKNIGDKTLKNTMKILNNYLFYETK